MSIPDWMLNSYWILQIALELESYQLASKQKGRLVQEAQLEVDYPVQWQATTPIAGEDVLQQLSGVSQGHSAGQAVGVP